MVASLAVAALGRRPLCPQALVAGSSRSESDDDASIQSPMTDIASRRDLLAEIDAEYARLSDLIDRVPPGLWTSSRVNSAGWSLKDVLAHVADWARRCDGWCALGGTRTDMTPPAAGFKWSETRALNHAIYLKRQRHTLARVLRDFRAGHAALRAHAATTDEGDLLAVGRFAWCGTTWSVAKHIRANTAAHERWASKHFKAALKAALKAAGAGAAAPASAGYFVAFAAAIAESRHAVIVVSNRLISSARAACIVGQSERGER